MKYRKLRIAWSVAWGVLCLLLIVLWVRSAIGHFGTEFLVTPNHRYEVYSIDGRLMFLQWMRTYAGVEIIMQRSQPMYFELISRPRYGIGHFSDGSALSAVVVPYWLLTSLTIFAAAPPWFPWRFSLRTLLIGMTVVAVAIGLIFALSR